MDEKEFKKKIFGFYKKNGRVLPWRKTRNSYKILVSEIMLQQTQVSRVLPKYQAFIKQYPDIGALAKASKKDVISIWSGLGYNRRALYLHSIACIVLEKYSGRIPKDPKILSALPGIGENTAGAIYCFSQNKPILFIETNIRSVFLHEWFPKKKKVHDKEIIPLIEKTLDTKNSREWYYALMDYGAYLKKNHKNPSRKSAHHIKQIPFEKSNRYIRGNILKILLSGKTFSVDALQKKIQRKKTLIRKNLLSLEKEGFIVRKKNLFLIR